MAASAVLVGFACARASFARQVESNLHQSSHESHIKYVCCCMVLMHVYSKYGALIWRPLTIIENKVHTALGRFIELVVIEPSVFRMFLPCLFAMTIFLIAG